MQLIMKITFQTLNVSIRTEVLSAGEQTYLNHLAEKVNRGYDLRSEESSFVKSMADRSNHILISE